MEGKRISKIFGILRKSCGCGDSSTKPSKTEIHRLLWRLGTPYEERILAIPTNIEEEE